jgi:hypothetical protein
MQAIPVNSGVPTRCNDSEQFAAAITDQSGKASQRNLPKIIIFLSPSDTRLSVF